MEKKISLIFLVFLLVGVLFFINLGSAQETCSQYGQVNYQTNQYCDGSVYVDMKNDRSSCLNNFECVNFSCVDKLCQSRFQGLNERKGLIQSLWDLAKGIQCAPAEDDCADD